MLNPITFQVEGESGPFTVTADGRDYAAYEERYKASAINDLFINDHYTAFMFVLWHAMDRQKLTELSFDDFLASTPQFGAPAKVDDLPPLGSPAPTG